MKPDDFRTLVAAGLTTEQIAVVMEMMERDAKVYADADEARKAKGRERVAKWRLEHPRNVTETSQKVSVRLTGEGVRVEDKTLTSEIEPLKEESKKRAGRDASEFRSELSDLDTERLDALVSHRKGKRAPNTGHAAKLFRRDAEKCGLSVADAVDMVISRNWITVKPEWLAEKRQQGPPSQLAPSISQIFSVVRDRPHEIEPEPPEDRSGFRAAIQDLRPARTG